MWRDYNRRTTERNVWGILKCKHNGSKSSSSKSNGPTSDKPKVSKGYGRDLESIGTEAWVGRCAGNGYCLEGHRVYLLG